MAIRPADISDYLISYRGHGMIEHATTSNSTGHVINHEQRHIAEFENRTRIRGQKIVREDISISYKFIKGKIVAVGGEATAAAKPEADSNSGVQIDSKSAISSPEFGQSASAPDSATNKIDNLLNKIENALSTIRNRLDDITTADGQDKTEHSALEENRLDSKKQKLESKLAELKSEKFELTQKEILSGLVEMMNDTANLLGAIYAIKTGNENSDSSDNYSKVEVPEYSMKYTGLILDTMI